MITEYSDRLRWIEPNCTPGIYELATGHMVWVINDAVRGTIALRLTADDHADLFTYFGLNLPYQVALFRGNVEIYSDCEGDTDEDLTGYYGVINQGPGGYHFHAKGHGGVELLPVDPEPILTQSTWYMTRWGLFQWNIDEHDDMEVLVEYHGPLLTI